MPKYKPSVSRRRYAPYHKKSFATVKAPGYVPIPRGLSLQSPSMLPAKLRFSDYRGLTPASAGLAASHVYSANSLFDPDRTGVGHQPRGFDQYIAMYENYTVTSATITVTFSATINSNNVAGHIVGIVEDNGVLLATDRTDLTERPRMIKKTLGNNNSNAVTTCRYKCDLSKRTGFNNILNAAAAKGSSISSPSEEVYLKPFVFALNQTDAPSAVRIQVQIDYTCVFSEPKQPSLS